MNSNVPLSLEAQLEAHPINSNTQLLQFDVRSKSIDWKRLITPLHSRNVQSSRHLGRYFNYLANINGNSNQTRCEVLLCHDMMGNYLEDRFFESSKKWDDYRFYHWSGIDYFCYFSHHYITIPPCGWINAAHLHGVKVIGTFITEGHSGTQLLLEALESRSKIEQICDGLTKLCEHFCFEGWLINIECNVPTDKVEYLIYFVETLRQYVSQKIPDGIVFWYDSVIHNGAVSWQNEINDKNVRFFNVSDGMLINYNWNDRSMKNTSKTIRHENKKQSKAFFGIDVFGRGQIAKFQSNQTLARIAQRNFSVGIFAPGWTFETLKRYNYNIFDVLGLDSVNEAFLQRNEKFWWLLWDYFDTHSYTHQPFYTDFCLGSGKYTFSFGQSSNEKFFNLCRQSLQPSVPLNTFAERHYDDAVNGGSCLKIIKADQSFRLFVTDFVVDKAFIFAYAYKLNESVGELDLILRFCEANSQKDCYLMCGDYNNTSTYQKGRCYMSPIRGEYHADISRIMYRENTPMKLPFKLENGWRVRYFGASFDNLVMIKDIGVLFKKRQGTFSWNAGALLGAIYFNSFAMDVAFDGMTNWAHISNEFVLLN